MSIVKAAECTYNIILASEVMGLSHKERKMVAEIIRQSALKTERTLDMELEEEFMEDGIRIRKLSALLSIADFMDLSHRQKVLGIRLKQEKTEWKLTVKTKQDYRLERSLFHEAAGQFEEIYQLKPVLIWKRDDN